MTLHVELWIVLPVRFVFIYILCIQYSRIYVMRSAPACGDDYGGTFKRKYSNVTTIFLFMLMLIFATTEEESGEGNRPRRIFETDIRSGF